MKSRRRRAWSGLRHLPLAMLAALTVGCEDFDDGISGPIGGGGVGAPGLVEARFEWLFQGWRAGQPVGMPSVSLHWTLPAGWRGEAFRVYARRAGQTDYPLIATVTSCTSEACRYTDVNVLPATAYDYFVTAVDERTGRESEGSVRTRATVPASSPPEAPEAPNAIALDGAVFLHWAATGAERYRVLLESENGAEVFDIGATDGDGFLDARAVNGRRYRYRLAAVDTLGRVSALGPARVAVPRPDHQAELIYAHADSAAASGFQFVASDSLNPIVPGGAAGAQLRLERVDGILSWVPLGGATLTTGVLTSALTCGPGADPDCFAIGSANDPRAPRDFAARSVAVAAEMTYLVRVRGADGRARFGKIRVTLEGSDQRGRDLVVFDWAYQLIPDEPSLGRSPR